VPSTVGRISPKPS